MKLKREDKVIVITGKDRGKTGTISAVLPATGQVVVDGVNVVKRHTKPSQKQPRGGILEITKPIAASKVMAIDPATGKPARIGYHIRENGVKERIFKVSPNHDQAAKKAEKKAKPAKTAEVTEAKAKEAKK